MITSVDFETYYQEEVYSTKELAPTKYVQDPRFDAYLVSVCDGSETWVGHPRDLCWSALEGQELVSHNSSFDETVALRLMELGLVPRIHYPAWHCSSNMAAGVCRGIRALDVVVKHLYGVDVSKGLRKWMNGKTWADAVAAGKADEIKEYARRDAYWCWRIWNEHSAQWNAFERQLADLTISTGREGVAVDAPLLNSYLAAMTREVQLIEDNLPWVARGEKPTGTKAIREECARSGIPIPPIKKNDPEAFQEWEEEHGRQFPWIAEISNWRSATKVLAALQTIKGRLRGDCTIEAPLKYFGAATGRWAGDGGLNFQNFRKEPFKAGDLDVDVRRLIVPRPGHKIISVDLAQIEPRCLAYITRDEEMLEQMRAGVSIYEAFARATGIWTRPEKLKDGDNRLYQRMKISVLMLGYQAGWRKLQSSAAKAPYFVTLSDEEAQETVNMYREKAGKVRALWGQLDQAFRASIGGDFEMGLPSGRLMTYHDVRRQTSFQQEADGTVKRRTNMTALVAKYGRYLRLPFYGGKIVENLIQATARDVFATNLLRVRDAGHRVLFTVHDEAVLEVRPEVKVDEIVDLMSHTPPWLMGCPVSAEAKEAQYYVH